MAHIERVHSAREGNPASAFFCGDKIGLSLTLLQSTIPHPVGVKKVSDCVGLKSRFGVKSEREPG